MKWLAIDTSAKHLTVSVFNGENVTTSYIEDTRLQHSITLLTEIDNTLSKANVTYLEKH